LGAGNHDGTEGICRAAAQDVHGAGITFFVRIKAGFVARENC